MPTLTIMLAWAACIMLLSLSMGAMAAGVEKSLTPDSSHAAPDFLVIGMQKKRHQRSVQHSQITPKNKDASHQRAHVLDGGVSTGKPPMQGKVINSWYELMCVAM